MNASAKIWIAVALVVVYLAGIATGFLGAAHQMHRRGGPPHGGPLDDRMRLHLREQLKLTPDQARAIDPIVEQLSAQLEGIRGETTQRVRQAMEQSHEQMKPLLTPAQLAELEKMRAHHEEMLRRQHRPGGPPPLP